MKMGRGGSSFISGFILGAGVGVLFREILLKFRSSDMIEEGRELLQSPDESDGRAVSTGGPRRGAEAETPRNQDNKGAREIPIQSSSERKKTKKSKRARSADTTSTEELH